MKVIISGSEGQLGQALIKSKPKFINLIDISKDKFNLLDEESIKKNIELFLPDWIINCAAYTNVDKAESDRELTIKVNGDGPKNIANILKRTGGNLLQISTDFVFNGSKNLPYKTYQEKNPINLYGYSKSIGEDYILDILQDSNQVKIIRTSWLMGPVGNNFALKIFKLHQTRKELNIVSDQIGSPTSTFNLARACWETINISRINKSLLKNNPILHWTNDGIASWYDIAYAIGHIGERTGLLKKSALVNPIKSKDYITPAKRPSYSVLDTFSTKRLLNINSNHWLSELEKDLNQIQHK